MKTIYFTKLFLTGNLKDLSATCWVSYPTVEDCAKRIYIGKKGIDAITKARWIVTDASFQKYQR